MRPRGIIIIPSNIVKEKTFDQLVDPGYLRKCLLYWDLIDCPDSAIDSFHVLPKNESDFLVSCGILRRTAGYLSYTERGRPFYLNTSVETPIKRPYEFFQLAQMYALKKHYVSDQSEHWSLGQVPDPLTSADRDPSIGAYLFRGAERAATPAEKFGVSIVPGSSRSITEVGLAVGLELLDALPVPGPDLPLEAILEFKHKRWDELLRFRHALDGLYVRAQQFGGQQAATEYVVDEIDVSLRDISKAMGESFSKRFFSTLKAELSINDLVIGAAGGGIVGKAFGLPLVGAVVGAAMPALRISLDSSLLRPKQVPENCKDYAYLYHAGKELGARGE